MNTTSFNGYSNSATFGAALYLENERKACDEFNRLWTAGKLNGDAIKATFEKFALELEEWMEGEVNWEEIYTYTLGVIQEQISYQPSIQNDALAVLSSALIENNTVKLTTGQLERKLFEKVDKILETLGGKWNRKAGGHVFKSDPTEQIEDVLLTGKIKKPEKYGFFPTPPELAKEVIRLANLEPGLTVFEPSAGSANLADIASELVGKENVICCEFQPENVQLLRNKGYQVVNDDFTKVKPAPVFEVVIMNPPFERQQDIIHVLHAWEFLKPGGILVSIMSASTTFRNDRKSTEFRTFLEEYGYLTHNPEGSFKPSGTNVQTITVVLNKPVGIQMAPDLVAEHIAAMLGKIDPFPILAAIPVHNNYGQYNLF